MKIKLITIITTFLCFSLILTSCDDDDKGYTKLQLSELSIAFIDLHFPENKITSIKKEDSGYLVTIEEGIIIFFNSHGSWEEVTAINGIPQTAESIISSTSLKQLKEIEPNTKIVNLKS